MDRSFAILAAALWVGVNVLDCTAGDISGSVTSEWLESKEEVLVFIERVAVDSARRPAPPARHPKMDQRDLRFIPHVLPILVGTTVDFPNSDKVQHNVFSPSKTEEFNLGSYPPGDFREITFDQVGKVVLLCNVHPEMSAFIIVLNNPYFALTNKDGQFRIRHVPPGQYRLSTWHKSLATETKAVTVVGEKTSRVDFNLQLGDPTNLLKLLR